jgi:hypothetical protein
VGGEGLYSGLGKTLTPQTFGLGPPLRRKSGRGEFDRHGKGRGAKGPRGLFAVRPVQAARATLRRATRAAAAAPNRRIIGGAGTSWPPLELVELPPELELLVDELVLLDVLLDELPEVEPLVLLDPLEPKLLDPPVAPELVDEVEVEPPVAPELVEVDVVDPLKLELELDPPDEPLSPDEP